MENKNTEKRVIEIAKVEDRKTRFSVTDTKGRIYSAWKNEVGEPPFENGKELEVEVAEVVSKTDGKIYTNIVGVAGHQNPVKEKKPFAGGGGYKPRFSPEDAKAKQDSIEKMHRDSQDGIRKSVALQQAVVACTQYPIENCKTDDVMVGRIQKYADTFLAWLIKK
jgi:hypothetical protein